MIIPKRARGRKVTSASNQDNDNNNNDMNVEKSGSSINSSSVITTARASSSSSLSLLSSYPSQFSSASLHAVTDFELNSSFQDFLLSTKFSNGNFPLLIYIIPDSSILATPWAQTIIDAARAVKTYPNSLKNGVRSVLLKAKVFKLSSLLDELYAMKDEYGDRALSKHPNMLTYVQKIMIKSLFVEEMRNYEKRKFDQTVKDMLANEELPDDPPEKQKSLFSSSYEYSKMFIPLLKLEVESQIKSDFSLENNISYVVPQPKLHEPEEFTKIETIEFDEQGNSIRKKRLVPKLPSSKDNSSNSSSSFGMSKKEVCECTLRFSFACGPRNKKLEYFEDLRRQAHAMEDKLIETRKSREVTDISPNIRAISRASAASDLRPGDFCILSLHSDSIGYYMPKNSGSHNKSPAKKLTKKLERTIYPCLIQSLASFSSNEQRENPNPHQALTVYMDIKAYVPKTFVAMLKENNLSSSSSSFSVGSGKQFHIWKGPNVITYWREYEAVAKLVSNGSLCVPLAETIITGKSVLPIGVPTSSSKAADGLALINPKLKAYIARKYNKNQSEAIFTSIANVETGFSLILGPPGTGKTHTILGILNLLQVSSANKANVVRENFLREFLKRKITLYNPRQFRAGRQSDSVGHIYKPYSKILVCAPSNAAVDGISTRMANYGFVNDEAEKKYHPNFVRIGKYGGSYDTGKSVDDDNKNFGNSNFILDCRAAIRGIDDHINWMLDIYEANNEKIEQEFESLCKDIKGKISEESNLFNQISDACADLSNPKSSSDSNCNNNNDNGNSGSVTSSASSQSNGSTTPMTQMELHGLVKKYLDVGRKISKMENDAQLLHAIIYGDYMDSSSVSSTSQGNNTEKKSKIGMEKGKISFSQKKKIIRQILIDRADIVFSTLSGSTFLAKQRNSNDLDDSDEEVNITFHTVLVDEAGQATEPSVLIPLCYNATKCILVGDPNQLPATVLSDEAAQMGLQRSLFERLQECGYETHLLNIQYRCHPLISKYFSSRFYDSKVIDGENVSLNVENSSSSSSSSAPPKVNHSSLYNPFFHQYPCFSPFVFFDVVKGTEDKSANLSYSNLEEAKLALNLYKSLKNICKGKINDLTVGIITPYAEQLDLINQLSKKHIDYDDLKGNQFEINTVDGFQGREVDIVIFSCVRASSARGSSIGFLNDKRRLNVAATRAKLSFLVLGNNFLLEKNAMWRDLIDYAKNHGKFIKVDTKDSLSCDVLKL